jgi:hypothetical protein
MGGPALRAEERPADGDVPHGLRTAVEPIADDGRN